MKGPQIYRSQIALALLFAVPVCSAAADEPGQKQADRYNAVLKRDFDVTGDVIAKYGLRLRIATELKECKLDALAEEVGPSKNEVADVVIPRLSKDAGVDEIMYVYLPSVWAAISFYQIGFTEAAVALHKVAGAQFCQQAAERANDILRERKAKK